MNKNLAAFLISSALCLFFFSFAAWIIGNNGLREESWAQLVSGILSGGMTVFAGWLAFREARANNEILRTELSLKSLKEAIDSLLYIDTALSKLLSIQYNSIFPDILTRLLSQEYLNEEDHGTISNVINRANASLASIEKEVENINNNARGSYLAGVNVDNLSKLKSVYCSFATVVPSTVDSLGYPIEHWRHRLQYDEASGDTLFTVFRRHTETLHKAVQERLKTLQEELYQKKKPYVDNKNYCDKEETTLSASF